LSQRLLILLDDEPVTSRALALDLADAGYRVSTAADPREVLRRVRAEPIDLLIADESRDSEDESRVVDEVRRIRPGAKVILMTTGPVAEGKKSSAGPVTRVRKPFDLEEFRAIVGRLLGEVKETNGSAR
jgi:two-component system OmpR family response regulator